MTILLVGISHKTAPVTLLEHLALDSDGVRKLLTDLVGSEHVNEAAVIATCNRIEVYADVDRFHTSVEEVSRQLTELAGDAGPAVLPHLYVHYEEAAVSQLFHVAAGLDSLAVGEAQILGQTRAALGAAQSAESAGSVVNTLFQQAIRVGKRAHAETDIDRAAPSLVRSALEACVAATGPVTGQRVAVVGAGSMAALALSTLAGLGPAEVTVLNRTEGTASALAGEYAVGVRSLDEVPAAVLDHDVVICCTGAPGPLVTVEHVRARQGRPVVLIDLALPHDVEPEVGALEGVTLINLASLATHLADTEAAREVDQVRQIVAEEVGAFVAAQTASAVTPTVVALRSMATAVVDAEIARLDARLDLSDTDRAEVLQALRRVSDKLLHQPTVRVRELAGSSVDYASALAELFALDSESVAAVTQPVIQAEGESS